MQTQDLETAKKRLHERKLTLCITKNGETIFETNSHGISGFLRAIQRLEVKLEGAYVADRVVGKAIALLCIYTKVRGVYASTISKKAKKLLEENVIQIEWGNLVENILDPDKATTCPFEKLAAKISDPEEAYLKLRTLQDSLEQCR
jgi:hypothetical protein